MAKIEVDLPWGMEEIDLAFPDVGPPRHRESPSVWDQLKWLQDTGFHPATDDDTELRRIFLAAGVLAERFPDRPFNECLDQAIVWERG